MIEEKTVPFVEDNRKMGSRQIHDHREKKNKDRKLMSACQENKKHWIAQLFGF